MSSRRAFLFGVLAVGGCGFQPVNTYRSSTGGRSTAGLSAIAIEPIRERNGQMLRNALLDRLDPRGPVAYALRIDLTENISSGLLSIDSAATRRILTSSASFELRSEDDRVVASGVERTETRYDITRDVGDAFADIAAEDAARRRVTEQLADRIVRRLSFALARPSTDTP